MNSSTESGNREGEAGVGERMKAPRANPLKKVNMKTAVIVAAIVVVIALLYASRGVFIAAMVDGKPISRIAVIEKLESAYGKATLDSLIIETLIENEAERQGIAVTNEEIDAELAKIEGQISAQGANLDELLEAQGMTRNDLRGQIILQKKLDKMVADKVVIAEADVDEYIKTMQVAVPKGEEGIALRAQIMEQMKAEKSAEESQKFVDSLRSAASINRFVEY